MSKASENTRRWREAHPDIRAYRREEARKYRLAHPDKVRAKARRHRERNLEAVRERDKLAARARRAADPEGQRRRNQAYVARQREQRIEIAGRPPPERCELCGEVAETKFDHDHATGAFRGWICDRCNRTLGQVHDDIHLLAQMIAYLTRGGTHGEVDGGRT
jgi:hypothetical protein